MDERVLAYYFSHPYVFSVDANLVKVEFCWYESINCREDAYSDKKDKRYCRQVKAGAAIGAFICGVCHIRNCISTQHRIDVRMNNNELSEYSQEPSEQVDTPKGSGVMACFAVIMGLGVIFMSLAPDTFRVLIYSASALLFGYRAIVGGKKYPKRFGIIGISLALVGVLVLLVTKALG